MGMETCILELVAGMSRSTFRAHVRNSAGKRARSSLRLFASRHCHYWTRGQQPVDRQVEGGCSAENGQTAARGYPVGWLTDWLGPVWLSQKNARAPCRPFLPHSQSKARERECALGRDREGEKGSIYATEPKALAVTLLYTLQHPLPPLTFVPKALSTPFLIVWDFGSSALARIFA